MTKKSIKEIRYDFSDASVPPEHHRSYTITVTPDAVRVVVDSYGDILADRTYGITDKQFSDVRNSLEMNKIRNCTLGEDEGCTGGTSETISCTDGKKEIFSGSVYHCGGKDTGNLCGDISRFAVTVGGLVPDFDALLKGGIQNGG
ncbi:MAG: hypothetical protein ABII96_09485 [Candidatus Zixiibacteriota bacterium]